MTQFSDTTSIQIHSGLKFADYELFDKALDKVKNENVRIVIHPDYDVDGVMGGRIAKTGLDVLKISDYVELYYPKSSDGYGLSKVAVDKILELWPDCKYILTVDNGINTKEAVDYAYDKGISVIVTDHHDARIELFPDKSIAAINPKRVDKPDLYPFKGISGTCVIWKLLLAYAEKRKLDLEYRLIYNLLPLVGISIISDVMPTTNENRKLLRDSINIMNDLHSIMKYMLADNVPKSYIETFNGLYQLLKYLLDNNKYQESKFSDETIGFFVAPMLNSPRRMMDDSTLAFQLFSLSNHNVITQLHALNEQRKQEVALMSLKIMTNYEDCELYGIVEQDDELRHGIVGLISGQITEKYKVPSIVLSHDYSGSVRAPYSYDLISIFETIDEKYPEYIVKWGGHSQAAGIEVNKLYFEEFKKVFNEECLSFLKTVKVDDRVLKEKSIELDCQDLPSIEEVKQATSIFNSIKPYSFEVPEPKFKITFDYLDSEEKYLSDDKHVKFTISDKRGNKLDMIVWGQGLKAKEIDMFRNPRITICGVLSLNEWKSYTGRLFENAQITTTVMSVEYMS